MSDQPEVANVCVWGEVVAVSDVLEPACTRSNERSDVREPATGNILRNTPEGHSMNETCEAYSRISRLVLRLLRHLRQGLPLCKGRVGKTTYCRT
jgi:hypothetical protein